MNDRTKTFRRSAAVVAVLLLAALGACKKKEEPAPPVAPAPAPAAQVLRVTEVQLGRAIGTDKRVTDPTETFAPADTIYVAVATDGTAPSATLAARWTYEDGQVVDEESQAIAPTGPAVTEFHISKPDGWPAGGYQVVVSLDGAPVATESFRIE